MSIVQTSGRGLSSDDLFPMGAVRSPVTLSEDY